MDKRNFLGVTVIFFIVSFLIINSAIADEMRGITKDTIKIGLIADTTGRVANLGSHLLMGCQDYFKNINDKGGIHGRKIQLIHEDDQYQTPKALAAFEKLVFKDEVLAILHCGGTPQTMALMGKIAKEHVPIIPPGQWEQMYKPYKRYIFAFGSTYADQASCAIDYMMHELNAKNPKVGIVYMENEVGRLGLKACIKRLNQYGLKPAAQVELSLRSVDASSQVMSLKKVNADYVILFELPPGVINFLKTAQKFNYYPTYLSYTWCADDSLLKVTGKAAKGGYYAASVFGAWNDDTSGARELRAIASKYGHSSPKLPSLYIQGYTDSDLISEGIRRTGRNITVEKFVDSMETFKDYNCGGMLSPMTYSPKSHPPSPYSKIFKADFDKGVFVSATDWIKPRNLK